MGPLIGLVDDPRAVLGQREVARHDHRLPARGADRARDLGGALRRAAVVHRHVPARVGERAGDRRAEAAAGAGDQGLAAGRRGMHNHGVFSTGLYTPAATENEVP